MSIGGPHEVLPSHGTMSLAASTSRQTAQCFRVRRARWVRER